MRDTKPSKKKFTLSKSERLKGRTVIQNLFDCNQSIKLYPFKVVWMKIPDQELSSINFGVSVSKRLYKTAVMRNKVKRKVREAYRLNKYILLDKIAPLNCNVPVMFIYTGKTLIPYSEIEKKMKQLLSMLAKQIEL